MILLARSEHPPEAPKDWRQEGRIRCTCGDCRQLQTFEAVMAQLLKGYPIGHAMEAFNQRYAALAEALAFEINEIHYGMAPDELKLSGMWTANNDARSYAVIGDPAVRLAVGVSPPAADRPVIATVTGVPVLSV